ncbi:D-alanyl-D-alanine carboxypeptidase family protein [Arthrobacter sp. zg-Y1143]|uniref:D-alanyl-D-alanine carboxypeptidase family protein n=1 Tax=Arthrobacter sp. zg-Y1143 TaxID=3049065 RepID=UPI0024C248BD|nr:D-alanyl-D-alanine carboxypeptidase family protein [Arthrobacter sp. zg-Y1143]MDK1327195.1 D-alanyl-D-alanine carboxypeptidase family protein [Arthrobacter sp. zg-Y1143]
MARHTARIAAIAAGVFVLLSGTAAVQASGSESGKDRLFQETRKAHTSLGRDTGSEVCGLRDDGCSRQYAHGAIVWSPRTGAQPIVGGMRAAWNASGAQNGPLGYPADAEACLDGECVQHFQRGTVFWSASSGPRLQLDIDDPAGVPVLVNKDRALPADYVPGPLVAVDGQPLREDAAVALQQLQDAAAAEGVGVMAISGYRSYAEQSVLYERYTAMYGAGEADRISARPGHSEHQTGLAADIGNPDGSCALQECFRDTAAGSWAAANAHRFGFIVRYQDGQTATTGYAYEPWHLRYVGVATATAMVESGYATYEEFAGIAGRQ